MPLPERMRHAENCRFRYRADWACTCGYKPNPWTDVLIYGTLVIGVLLVSVANAAYNGKPAAADRSGPRPSASTPVSRGGERAIEVWQYRVVEYKPANGTYGGVGLEAWMNRYGAEGWEHISGSAYLSRHVFKRRAVKL